MNNAVDVLVLGGGPGGYTAALYAARAGLSVLVLERLSAGGQMATTGTVENYPGFEDGVDGFELGEKMQRQAQRFGARTVLAEVREVALTESPKRVETDRGTFLGRTVVVATGAEARELGVPGEAALRGRGVSYCATCDAHFYKGKAVAVLGYNAESCREADFLAETCARVLYFPVVPHEVNVGPNVTVVRERVLSIPGTMRAEGVQTDKDLHPVDGVFVLRDAVAPDKLVPGLATDGPHVAVDAQMRTNLPGCFACGDLAGKPYQYIKAAGQGNIAALSAVEWLAEQK